MRKYILLVLILFLATNKGYSTWRPMNSPTSGDIYGVHFQSQQIGYIIGESGIYKTTDTGLNWTSLKIIGNTIDSIKLTNSLLNDLIYAGTELYVIGYDTINNASHIYSYDNTSGLQISNSIVGKRLNSIAGNQFGIIAVGDSGLISYSLNNGNTWSVLPSGTQHDLNSVHAYSFDVVIGGDSIFMENRMNTFSTSSWQILTPIAPIKKIDAGSSGKHYAINPSNIFSWNIINGFKFDTIYHRPLNANAISFFSSNNGMIATENGIYRSYANLFQWEKFSSSVTQGKFNDIFCLRNANYAFAVGDNGKIIYTHNRGRYSYPIAHIQTLGGGCIGDTLILKTPNHYQQTYQWFRNGNPFSTSLQVSITYNSAVRDSISLITTRYNLSDTTYKIIEIFDKPKANLKVSSLDSMICKKGVTNIKVDSTEIGILYKLIKTSSGHVTDSMFGNGSSIFLNTDSIFSSSTFKINAIRVNSNCAIYLDDSVTILVEKTLARFNSAFINSNMNDEIPMLNGSENAAYYDWRFGSNSSSNSTSSFEPVVRYNSIGSTSVTLIATSTHGCKDTLTKPGPVIYSDNLLSESCWAMRFDGSKESSFEIYDHDRGKNMKLLSNGELITTGSYSINNFTSRAGVNSGINSDVGYYVARYSTRGVLRWLVKGVDLIKYNNQNGRPANSSFNGIGYDIAIDNTDNVYVVGDQDDDFVLIDNKEDSVSMDNQLSFSSTSSFIIKLNDLGVLQWKIGTDAVSINTIETDSQNNIIISGFANSTGILRLPNGSIYNGFLNSGHFILKLNPNGIPIWNIELSVSGSSSDSYLNINDISINKHGEISICGQHSRSINFNSVVGTVKNIPSAGNGSNIFIARYSSLGECKWVYSVNSITTSSYTFDKGIAIATSDNGDAYMAVESNAYYQGQYLEIHSNKPNVDYLYAGRYALITYDRNGNYTWGTGIQYSLTGKGTAVTIDKSGFVYTAGIVANNSPTTGVFTSTDTVSKVLPVRYGAMFIAKYSSAGNLIWATGENGLVGNPYTPVANPNSICVDNAQNVFLFGSLRGSGSGSSTSSYTIATSTLTTNGQDAYIAKFSTSACLQNDDLITNLPVNIFCKGSSYKIPVNVTTNTLAANNTYNVELSDSSGSFSSSQIIGSLYSNNISDSVDIVIPMSLNSGNYFIRTTTNSPILVGNKSRIIIGGASNTTSITDSTCFNYISPSGKYIWDSSGVYLDTIMNSTNCDSIITINLSVNSIDNSINRNGNILTCNQQNAYYRWIDCSTGNYLPNDTTNSLLVTQNGSYSVEIRYMNCVDTSNCINIIGVGMDEDETNIKSFSIFPNPTAGVITINNQNIQRKDRVYIYDVLGNLVHSEFIVNSSQKVDLNKLANGVYILRYLGKSSKLILRQTQ